VLPPGLVVLVDSLEAAGMVLPPGFVVLVVTTQYYILVNPLDEL
jgi:hypothetical protein